MSLIYDYVGNLVLSFAQVYSWSKITGRKIQQKKIVLLIDILLLSLLITINHNFINNFAKGIVIIFISIIFCTILFKTKIRESIVLSFVSEILIIFCEAFVVLVMTIMFRVNMNDIANSVFIHILFDIIVSMLVIMVSKLKFIIKFYNHLIKATANISNYQILLFILFAVFSITTAFTIAYFKNNVYIVVAISISISIVYLIITIMVFNYQNRYYKIKLKYNTNLDNLQEYELIISDYRIMNHENKNQLLTIKSMTKNAKVIKYINSLIDYKDDFNDEILNITLKIPEGGIRGLIYSKILYMRQNNINCNLQVDKLITAKIMDIIDDDTIVDTCQILGVFIDNAIEEVAELDDKIINIELHLSDDSLIITISNPFKYKDIGNLKSTKGINRGYGLQLVKRVVEYNKRIINEREISKDLYKQKLVVKLKK